MTEEYMIRVQETDDLVRINKLYQLEELLSKGEKGELKNVIASIDAVTAFLYDPGLVDELEQQGYELIPQEKSFRATTELNEN